MCKRAIVILVVIMMLFPLSSCRNGNGDETETDVTHGDVAYIKDVTELSDAEAELVYGLLLGSGMSAGIKYLAKWQDLQGNVYYRVRTASEVLELREDGCGSYTVILIDNGTETTETAEETELTLPEAGDVEVVINVKSKKFHHPDCRSASSMNEENRLTAFVADLDALTALGYSSCANCAAKFSKNGDTVTDTETEK